MKPIIKVENLSKEYKIGESKAPYATLRDSIVNTIRNPFKALRKETDNNKFWALKDISFEINPGEVVGIIGRNGAGKSTLLKVLSRITEPTTGEIALYGRVGSLLEVGTGFHAELSGRENIFLNGAILGMKRSEISKKFDEIVAFAEIEKFIDTPVKHYSSGMYVRLAFAVAAHLEPEILIIDEVLAVGDSEFQKKCLGKIKDVSEHGRTVIFVSHNMTAIKSLCTTGIYLQKGEIINSGNIQTVVDNYISGETMCSRKTVNVSNEDFTIDSIEISDNGIPGNFDIDDDLTFNIEVNSAKNFELININLFFNAAEGGVIFATCSPAEKFPEGNFLYKCIIPANTLNDNVYSIDLMVIRDGEAPLHNIMDILSIKGNEPKREGAWLGKFPGLIRPMYFNWNKTRIS